MKSNLTRVSVLFFMMSMFIIAGVSCSDTPTTTSTSSSGSSAPVTSAVQPTVTTESTASESQTTSTTDAAKASPTPTSSTEITAPFLATATLLLDTVTIGGGENCRLTGICNKIIGDVPVAYATVDNSLVVAFNINVLKQKQQDKVSLFEGKKFFVFETAWKVPGKARSVMKNKKLNSVREGTKCAIDHKGDTYWFAIPLQ